MRCVSPVADAVRGTTARLSFGEEEARGHETISAILRSLRCLDT